MFQFLVDFIRYFWDFLEYLFQSLVDSIYAAFKDLGLIIGDAIIWFFTEFFDFVFSQIGSLFDSAFSLLNLPYEFEWVDEILQTINFFVPFSELLAISSVMLLFWLNLFIIKVVLKAFPTVY